MLAERGIAVGDFDGDGKTDLAVGAPGEDIGSATDAGEAQVIYGSPTGLTSTRHTGFSQGPRSGNTGGLGNTPESGDYLGSALATGNFDGDGYDDLAIGVSGESSSVAHGGLVQIIYGSPTGLDPARVSGGRQGGFFAGADEAGDYLGASVTSGDFNGDGRDDLAAGVPGENSSVADGGEVLTVMGSATGLDPSTAGGGRQGGFFAGADEAGDYLGASVTSGDFNGDGRDDLAAGVPGENSSVADGGEVLTVMGSATGLDPSTAGGGRQGGFFAGADEAGDYLGASVTSGDFNGDGRDDLAAGVPGENSSVADGGEVLTVMGSATGLDPSTAGGGRQGGFFAGADEAGDYLGASVTSGDFNGDGRDDLAAGVPGENSSVADGGEVLTVMGSATGLDPSTAGGGRQGGFFGRSRRGRRLPRRLGHIRRLQRRRS